MNDIILAFAEQSENVITQIEIIEVVLVFLPLLILWFEFKFIFRPMNKELQDRKEKLEKLNESKDRILATVAHDVRNPLSPKKGINEILVSEIENLSPENKALFDMSLESCNKAEKLI